MIVDKPIDMKPGELRCPRCFHKDIVPSLPRGWFDAFMGWLGRIPRHCRFCEKRFYISAHRTQPEPLSEPRP